VDQPVKKHTSAVRRGPGIQSSPRRATLSSVFRQKRKTSKSGVFRISYNTPWATLSPSTNPDVSGIEGKPVEIPFGHGAWVALLAPATS
jgi:hypothetical protein